MLAFVWLHAVCAVVSACVPLIIAVMATDTLRESGASVWRMFLGRIALAFFIAICLAATVPYGSLPGMTAGLVIVAIGVTFLLSLVTTALTILAGLESRDPSLHDMEA